MSKDYEILSCITGEKVKNVTAQFDLIGYTISFSTFGMTKNKVIVFKEDDNNFSKEFESVEDAVYWIMTEEQVSLYG